MEDGAGREEVMKDGRGRGGGRGGFAGERRICTRGEAAGESRSEDKPRPLVHTLAQTDRYLWGEGLEAESREAESQRLEEENLLLETDSCSS